MKKKMYTQEMQNENKINHDVEKKNGILNFSNTPHEDIVRRSTAGAHSRDHYIAVSYIHVFVWDAL